MNTNESTESIESAGGLGTNVDGLYAPMSSVADVDTETPASAAMPDGALVGLADSLRGTVRDNPLSTLAAAAVFGMLLMRLTR